MSEEQPPDWIDKIVKLAGALGMNQTRVRWKLIRWQENRRRAARRLEQKLEHVKYEHKTCHECGAVQDKDAKVCTSCNAKLAGRGVTFLQRLGVFAPQALSMSTLLAIVIMACYMRVLVAQGGGIGTPSAALLFDFGAYWPLGAPDDHWRLLTGVFLHIGLLHLLFNLLGLATMGPQIEALWGRTTMLFIFVSTAVLAFVGSGAMQPWALTAGASGGLCGLLGAGIGWGQRLGTTRGRLIRNDNLKWLAYTIIFGFAVHANNYAHGFGALAGAVMGYAVRPETFNRPALFPVRALVKLAGIVATIAAVVIIFTRTKHDDRFEQTDIRKWQLSQYEFQATVCRMYFDGAPALAVAATQAHLFSFTRMMPPEIDERTVASTCNYMLTLRDHCVSPPAELDAMARRELDDVCYPVEKAFGKFPEKPKPIDGSQVEPAGSAAGSGSATTPAAPR